MPYAATVDHPGGTARFDVTRDALEMVASLGGHLHAYVGGEGCRAQSLAFTTREPRRALECRVDVPEAADDVDWEGTDWTEERLAALAERIPCGTAGSRSAPSSRPSSTAGSSTSATTCG